MSDDVKALRDRLRRINAACGDMHPKQAVGEMIVAMLDMPQWDRIEALQAEVERLTRIAQDRAGMIDGLREWVGDRITENENMEAEVERLREGMHTMTDTTRTALEAARTFVGEGRAAAIIYGPLVDGKPADTARYDALLAQIDAALAARQGGDDGR